MPPGGDPGAEFRKNASVCLSCREGGGPGRRTCSRATEVGPRSHGGEELEVALHRGFRVSLRRLRKHAGRLGWIRIEFHCCQFCHSENFDIFS